MGNRIFRIQPGRYYPHSAGYCNRSSIAQGYFGQEIIKKHKKRKPCRNVGLYCILPVFKQYVMVNKDTRQWTLHNRKRSYKMTLQAQERGFIPYPTRCDFCSQDKGIMRLYNEDHGFILNVLPDLINGKRIPDEELLVKISKCFKPLCYRCDMMHHSQARDPKAYSIYIQQIKDGVAFAPVFKHDYEKLIKDHGVGNSGLIST